MKNTFLNGILCVIFASSFAQTNKTSMNNALKPPVATIKPTKLEKHGDIRIDNYFWLNQRENPDVISYLEEENAYYKKMTSSTVAFQQSLFEEMRARIKEDDEMVPYLYNGYYYIRRFETGQGYPIYARKKETLEAPEEILFDCNKLADGHAYFNLGSMSVSRDNKFAAYSTDVVGRRIYTIRIKNLTTNELLKDVLENVTGTAVWANDNKTIFYTRQDEMTLRSDKVYKHVLGTDPKNDEVVYYEKDDTFSVEVGKEKSQKFIVIQSGSTLTTEYRTLSADKPDGKFIIFQKRQRGLEYGISNFDGNWYIVTNKDKATNFKLMKTPESKTSKKNWVDVIPHRKDVLLEDIEIFKNFLVLEERSNGLGKIRIIRWDGSEDYYLPFDIETYTASLGSNLELDTDILRFAYQSMATPASVIDFDMVTKTREIKKEQQVQGGKFDKNNYAEERLWATASDGTKIPMSVVYRKGMKRDGNNPLLLYAYGSYGASMEPYFSTTHLTLLDRGFIYAIAHIRGGEEMGRDWYEDGKLMKKKNTFNDYIDCSKYLINEKYTSAEHLYAEGGSAGGLLMGAIVNMAPQLYNGVIAQVPFVDVMTTMLDDSIPLTTGEYDEWGNPNEKEAYDYMRSYSPYDNVAAQNYPNMLITTGLHDSQVQYWEPAKWVAKLRTLKTDNNLLYLDTNMDAGHGGASGRFEALREVAKEFSFLLDLEKIKK